MRPGGRRRFGVFLLDSQRLGGSATVIDGVLTVERFGTPTCGTPTHDRATFGTCPDHDRVRTATRFSQWVTPVMVMWGDFRSASWRTDVSGGVRAGREAPGARGPVSRGGAAFESSRTPPRGIPRTSKDRTPRRPVLPVADRRRGPRCQPRYLFQGPVMASVIPGVWMLTNNTLPSALNAGPVNSEYSGASAVPMLSWLRAIA